MKALLSHLHAVAAGVLGWVLWRRRARRRKIAADSTSAGTELDSKPITVASAPGQMNVQAYALFFSSSSSCFLAAWQWDCRLLFPAG